ncbi:isoprenylcysteine carboxylmethyltransferase family protein [Fulvivirga sp. RKSG066]|uniref:methyltransferase family protein n=1 Tax=Fulvivirga aurantia TaxID=2529383 RepID=UPI0012BC38C9|nr:isoprenylcysteine carboxylmethyltransferase family protein [Fulvivirga aurantia]MTI21882.1 isoprenylcysteine carboxylmethyltransferase family protein [Fulvivirga aurantia]
MQIDKLHVVLVVGWVVYFVLHSLLASTSVKTKIERLGLSQRAYRLMFVLMSTVGLLVLLVINGLAGGERFLPATQEVKIIALFFGGGGVLIINAAFKQYSLKGFLGFENEGKQELVTGGILGYIRHPIYSGTILITLGFLVYDPRVASLLSVGCIYLYLIIGISLEEKKLTQKFGQLYKDYQNEVPALVPNIFKLFKKISNH